MRARRPGRVRAAVVAVGVLAASALGAAPAVQADVPIGVPSTFRAAADLPPQEPGVTLRVFDVGFEPMETCTLTEGQTPNVDVLRDVIDWQSTEEFGGIANNFMAHVIGNITVPTDGTYEFRLTSDDGSRLSINDEEIIVNDQRQPPTAVDGEIELTAGTHPLWIDYFQGAFDKALRLEWRPPGTEDFVLVPNTVLSTDEGVTRVTAPGVKQCADATDGPGDGAPLAGVHPNFTLTNLRPDGFEPTVTGMDWFDDGRMVITTWAGRASNDGAVEIVENTLGDTSAEDISAEVIAENLNEPQSIIIDDGDLIVSEKHQLSRLIDADGDGFYEDTEAIATWPYGGNFHEFAFGILADEDFYYLNLSVAINSGGATTDPQPAENRGTSITVDKETGEIDYVAGGLRTPNGIGWGPEGEIFVTDNQGGWLPSSKLVEIEPGAFYNHYTNPAGPFDDQPVTEPVLWLPQNEISNSPSNPVFLEEGIFAGQVLFGDVTYGGIQRGFLEEVEGQKQGAAFRMTQGLESGVSRLALGPDGSLYTGGIGGGGNWQQPGKLTYGLQKLTPTSEDAMDILSMEITETGFDLTYTKPVSDEVLENLAERYDVNQWRYNPTSQYGGPKVNEETLTVTGASASEDRRTVSLDIAGLREGRVVHIRSPRPFAAEDGTTLWSTEAWYTANEIPNYTPPVNALGMYEAEEGVLSGSAAIDTEHPHHTGSGFVDALNSEGATMTVEVDAIEAGTYPVTFRYANGPSPFDGTKNVTVKVNGGDERQVGLARTGSWQTWADHTESLDLEAGTNTVSLSVGPDDDGHVNVDHVRVQLEPCTPAAADDGYRMLFDGTDESFASWSQAGPGAFITQADCTMRSVGGSGLFSFDEDFGEYSLKLDWKMTGDDNSGVFVGFPDPQGDLTAREQGHEVQIDASDAPELTTGAIYNFQGADLEARDEVLNPPGEWNSYEIVVEDLVISVYLNGVLINEFDSDGASAQRDMSSGRIGFQNHHTGSDVFFRNVQIREISEAPEPEPEPVNETGMYELEDGERGGPAQLDTEHPHHTGTGYVDNFGVDGAAVTVEVEAPEAGTYPLTLRYANGPNPFEGTKTVSYAVNGADQGQLSLASTGTWQTWGDHTVEVELEAGVNTVTLSKDADDDGHVNLDHVRLQYQPCEATQPDEGYRMLFDGTADSLAEWNMAGPGDFITQADCSTFTVGGLGMLWHPEELSDYSLKLDWKMAGDDNSGVFVGFPNPGDDPWVAVEQGYEIQIDATDAPDRTTGAIYTFQGADAEAVEEALNPPGEWNSYELQVVDQSITVILNGVVVNEFTDAERDISSGHIGLQNHGTGDDVWFRDVQVRDLEDTEPEPEGPQATTVEVDAPASTWYGRPATLQIEVTGEVATPSGEVTVHANGRQVGTATLSADGTAQVTLPRLRMGEYEIEVRYAGEEDVSEPSTTTIEHSVVRPDR